MQPTTTTISQQHQTTLKIITQNPKHAHKSSQISFYAQKNLPTSPYARQNIKLLNCKQPSKTPYYVQNSKAPLQNAINQHHGGSMVTNPSASGNYEQNQTNLNNKQQPYHANTQNLNHKYFKNTADVQYQNFRRPQNNCDQNLLKNCGSFLK